MSVPSVPGDVELPVLQPSLRERIAEAWQSREVLGAAARSSIPTYRGRILGRAWLFIVPVMQVVSFNLLLSGVFHASAPNGVPYLLFLIFGMQAYRLLQMTLIYTTVSTKMLKTRTRAFRFPLLIVPFASLSRTLVIVAVYWTIAAVAIVYYAIDRGTLYLQPNLRLLVGLAGLMLVVLLALAIGLTTSAIYPRARDVRYFVRYSLHLWLFFTPILYSIQRLPHRYHAIAQINPLTPLVEMVQYGFLDAGELLPYGILWSVVAILAIGTFGLWFFNRYANRWIGVYQLQEDDEFDEDDIL